MSILADRIQNDLTQAGIFMVNAGARFGGKTTGAGVLEGGTLLLEASKEESGSHGALNMAAKQGNKLDRVPVQGLEDIRDLIQAGINSGDYTNIVVDSLTALAELEQKTPRMERLFKADKRNAYGELGTTLKEFVKFLKNTAEEGNINIILNCALKTFKNEEGEIVSSELDLPGNMIKSYLRGVCPFFVVSRMAADDKGNPVRIVQTKSGQGFETRMTCAMDGNLPSGFRADPDNLKQAGDAVGIQAVINYIKGE